MPAPDADDVMEEITDIGLVYDTLVHDRVIPDRGTFSNLNAWERSSWGRAEDKFIEAVRPKLAEAIEEAHKGGVEGTRQVVEWCEYTKEELVEQEPKLARLSESTLQLVTNALSALMLKEIDESCKGQEK